MSCTSSAARLVLLPCTAILARSRAVPRSVSDKLTAVRPFQISSSCPALAPGTA